jgi:ribosome biogenesis GTPase / thiamine phosphate phosphatase
MAKKKKTRVDLRKNRSKPPRKHGWTRGFQEHGYAEDATLNQERVRAKGDLSRKRTIIQDDFPPISGGPNQTQMPAVDVGACRQGRVLRVHGLHCIVQTDEGRQFRCTVRRLLKTLATEERSVVATGDRVWIRLSEGEGEEGIIEGVQPRHGLLTRSSRGREHVLVANVDQFVIVVSLVEPELKPHLIDRYLASAEQGGIAPIVCLNKADLVDATIYQPLVGLYAQLGIPVLLTSALRGTGIPRLRRFLINRQTVFAGQSGVGKSSLLNAIQSDLALRVREVSDVNQKGKHTTTTAELIQLDFGGWVVDTPGIRQFELWDILAEEVEGFFPELRPLVPLCGYPDCTHTHEDRCAVKDAVLRRLVSTSRYASYMGMFAGKMEEPRD